MKILQILDSQQGLKNLNETKLPVKVSYKIAKMIDRMQSPLRDYEEKRIALIKKLGKEDKEKNQWEVLPENLAEYQKEMQVLLNTDIRLSYSDNNELEKIKLDELGDVSLEPKDLAQLDWLFENE